MPTTAHELFATLFTYPSAGYHHAAAVCEAGCRREGALAAAGHLDEFGKQIENRPPGELEELWTQTFDLNPACALEVGWHLYGENYDRGAFLLRLRGLLREHGIVEKVELPDHLSHLFLLLGRMQPEESCALVRDSILPALRKILAALGSPQKEALPFLSLLLAAESYLMHRHIQEAEEVHHG